MVDGIEPGATSFEEKHLIAVMMYLALNGACRKIDIYRNVSSNPRIPEKLDRLEALGLITQVSDKNLRSIVINLTPKGKIVAQKIVDLDVAIKSD
jgi:hypothetical protein